MAKVLDYTVVRHNNVIVLAMSVDAAVLVKNALEVIDPDQRDMAGLAEKMALALDAAVVTK